jgi:hypothetical protein
MSQRVAVEIFWATTSRCAARIPLDDYSSKVDEYNKQVLGIEKDYSELVERLVSIK